MKLKIMVDSSSGISQDEASKLGIDVFPLRIIFENAEFLDGINITHEEFYDRLINSGAFPKTSLPNLYEVEQKVKEYVKEDYQVIILPLSREISGSYSAFKSLMEDYNDVRVIDTLTTTCGLRFLVNKAISSKAKNLDELVEELKNLQKKIRIVAGIDTLEYLYKGGRLTKTASIVANVIGLKPIISVIDGKVIVIGKRRGRKHAIQFIIDKVQEMKIDYNYPVYGLYSMYKENFQELCENFSDNKMKQSVSFIENIAPVIGCHIGPGAYGVAFIEKEDELNS